MPVGQKLIGISLTNSLMLCSYLLNGINNLFNTIKVRTFALSKGEKDNNIIQQLKNNTIMRLADEIRAKYATPHYTFDDVVNEIRRGVFSTYEEVAKYKFSNWPGFDVRYSDSIPQMEWVCGREVSCVHCLLIPRDSIDFALKEIDKWFEEQGFVHTKNENCRCEGWRIKF